MTEPWETLLPNDNQKHNLRSFSPRHWPYLPQEGDCTNNNHTCIFCRDVGHHPTFCPNAAWAIIFRKPKTYIPQDVRRHVLNLRGSEITIDELTPYVNKKFLKRMTKHYTNLKEPSALRGPKFSQFAFEKAESTWKIHHKDNPKHNSTFKSHSSEANTNEAQASRQTERKPKMKLGGNSKAFDEKQQDQDQGSIDWFENQMDGMQGIKTNAHSGANSQTKAIPTNPDEDDESDVREGSDNKVQGSDNKVQDSRNESDA